MTTSNRCPTSTPTTWGTKSFLRKKGDSEIETESVCVEGGGDKKKKKKTRQLCSRSPCQTVSVCVCNKMHPENKNKNKTGTSPMLKNLICRTEQQNIQARKNTPIMNVAVHYVATYTRSI